MSTISGRYAIVGVGESEVGRRLATAAMVLDAVDWAGIRRSHASDV